MFLFIRKLEPIDLYPMKITELFDVCNSQSRFLVQQVFDRGYESDTNEGEIIDFSFIRFFFYKLNVH